MMITRICFNIYCFLVVVVMFLSGAACILNLISLGDCVALIAWALTTNVFYLWFIPDPDRKSRLKSKAKN